MKKLKRSVFVLTVNSYEKSQSNVAKALVEMVNEKIPAEEIINVQMHHEYKTFVVNEDGDPNRTYFPGKVWIEVYHREEVPNVPEE